MSVTFADDRTGAPSAAYPGAAWAWFGVGVFFLGQIVSTMDRGILNLVVDPIRRDLHASEIDISLLQGLAFALFFGTVGLLLGFVADVVSRKRLLIFGAVVWCMATVAGGFAHDVPTMFVSRLVVGLGEAALGPCAVSMLSDLFPASRRGRPMSIYLLGGAISGGLANLLTGAILDAAPSGAFDVVPFLRGLAAWRIAFVIAGGLGLIVPLLLIFFRDPPRRGVVLATRAGLGVGQAARYLGANWKVFAPLYGAAGMFTMANSSVGAWGPSLLIRGFGAPAASVGKALGLANIAAAVAGSLIAGIVVEAVVRRGGLKAKLKWAPLIPLLGLPATAAVLAPGGGGATWMLAGMMVVMPIFGTALLSTATELVPSNMRGISVSIYSFLSIMLGATVGPLLVALATEHLFRSPALVGWSLMLVAGPALIACSALLACCAWRFGPARAANPDFASVTATVG